MGEEVRDVRGWLNRAHKIDQQIKSKQEQIEKWAELATNIARDPASLNTSGGVRSSAAETYGIKIADICAEIDRQLKELIDIKHEIELFIGNIESVTCRILLEQRYLLCKNWSDIAEFMGYTEQYIKQNLHEMAIEDAQELFSVIHTK